MNNDEFMNLFSSSANDNHQAQAQAHQESQPMYPVDPTVWGYFDNQGDYFSPQTTFDQLMGVSAPTESSKNETEKMLGEIQAAVKSVEKKLQSLFEKQLDMEEKLNRMIDDMGAFSSQAIQTWDDIYYQLTGERSRSQLFTEDVNSQSGDESGWEDGVSRSGRASV